MTEGYKGLQEVTRSVRGVRVTGGYKGLQGVTRGSQRGTRNDRRLQGVTGGYKG